MSQTMNKLTLFILTLGFLISGCEKPAPVELQQDPEDALLEVSSVAQGDSSLGLATVDSSAVLPEDQGKFACLLQVARVRFDAGQIADTSLAFAHVIVEDRNRPVQIGNRVIGYVGMNLGLVYISSNQNSSLMIPIGHRPGRRDTAGVEYYRDMNAVTVPYRPATSYTFRAFPDSLDIFPQSIETPEDINVIAPRGGSLIRRDRDLLLTWTGHGTLSFVISERLNGRARPILRVKVRNNLQHAVLSRKILQLLPPRDYVITFVLENRKEGLTSARFSGRVLVQAASVYNTYIRLI